MKLGRGAEPKGQALMTQDQPSTNEEQLVTDLPLIKQLRWPPILMYHAIDWVTDEDDPHLTCISPKQFEAQMLYLKRRNLRGVSMRELLSAMRERKARRLVGLTFDDGYENFLQTALPVLERFGFSATVFVLAAMFGKKNSWISTPQMKLLDIDEVREVAKRGIEIGSHGMRHTELAGKLDPRLLKYELICSRDILNKVLPEEVDGFCYPYGRVENRVVQAVQQAGYTYACGTSATGGIRWGSIYNTPRIFVGNNDGAFRLSMKLYAYAQYTKIAHTEAAKIARPLIRKSFSKLWFNASLTP